MPWSSNNQALAGQHLCAGPRHGRPLHGRRPAQQSCGAQPQALCTFFAGTCIRWRHGWSSLETCPEPDPADLASLTSARGGSVRQQQALPVSAWSAPPALPCPALVLGSAVTSRQLHELSAATAGASCQLSCVVSCLPGATRAVCLLVLDDQDTGMRSVRRRRRTHYYGAWVARQLESSTGSRYVARVSPAPCLCETALLGLSKVVLRGLRHTRAGCQQPACSQPRATQRGQAATHEQAASDVPGRAAQTCGLKHQACGHSHLHGAQAWLHLVSKCRAAHNPNRNAYSCGDTQQMLQQVQACSEQGQH